MKCSFWRWPRPWISVSVVAAACALGTAWTPSPAAAQSAPGPQAPAGIAGKPTSEPALRTTYVLGAEDQVTVHAVDVPDLSDKPQRIDPNGDIRLPLVGRIHAAGLTLEQLETDVRDRLKTFLRDPDVTVTVSEFHSQTVTVVGAVGQPGLRPIEGPKTLLEILTSVGGPTPDAGGIVRITRRLDQGRIPLSDAVENVDTGLSAVDIPLKPLLDATRLENNIQIRPNDIIAVPRAEVVYVVGEVNRAGPVPVTRGNSVSAVEAVSASGGVLKTAATGSARILRIVGNNPARTEIPVDLTKIMQGKSNDVQLFAGDILVVPNSTGKAATRRAVEVALQFGLLVGSYGILH
jgi:polysaccharide export outer membrane protein